jgi:DNA-binding response OmpR family regulator
MRKIWIVEDEPDIANLVAHNLGKEGFEARTFGDGQEFLQEIDHELPDLVILDLMLPVMDGLEICRLMRLEERTQTLPIVMLTSKTEELDIVLGLELGADDYIPKPFSVRELIARVKAVLRRTERPQDSNLISLAELSVDLDKFEATAEGDPINLTYAEFRILSLLISSVGRVFTRQQIIDRIWDEGRVVTHKTVDVHIAHLRRKLGEHGKLIKAVRGVGYKIEA